MRFDKISTNACFSENSNGLDSDFENLGTQLNIKRAHKTPKQAITGILDNPKNCAIEDETKGPVEKPDIDDSEVAEYIVENPKEVVVQFPIISDIKLDEHLPFFRSISAKLAAEDITGKPAEKQ